MVKGGLSVECITPGCRTRQQQHSSLKHCQHLSGLKMGETTSSQQITERHVSTAVVQVLIISHLPFLSPDLQLVACTCPTAHSTLVWQSGLFCCMQASTALMELRLRMRATSNIRRLQKSCWLMVPTQMLQEMRQVMGTASPH